VDGVDIDTGRLGVGAVGCGSDCALAAVACVGETVEAVAGAEEDTDLVASEILFQNEGFWAVGAVSCGSDSAFAAAAFVGCTVEAVTGATEDADLVVSERLFQNEDLLVVGGVPARTEGVSFPGTSVARFDGFLFCLLVVLVMLRSIAAKVELS
jgi:hypothetical protein